MAFTDNCDVFGSVHEDGLNRIVRHLMAQRPSLFNYATRMFAAAPERLCEPIKPHPEVVRRGNPLITVEDPLPIPGTDGLLGMDFCFQIAELVVDFHPGNQFSLPPELDPPLQWQRMALHLRVCGGIACPSPRVSDRYGDVIANLQKGLPAGAATHDNRPAATNEGQRPPITTIPSEERDCFCLDVFAVAHFELVGPDDSKKLAIRLDGLEIVDIRPEGLENSLECYIATTLRVGILPRLRIALDTLVYELGAFATISISPTPISASVPNNPAIENDLVKVFVNIGVA